MGAGLAAAMRTFTFLLLAAAVALLAGCLTGGDDDASTGDNNNETGDMGNMSMNETTSIPMNFQAAGPGPLGPDGGSFDVAANSSMVIFEARWTCTSPTCELAVSIVDEEGNEVASGSGNGEVNLEIPEPAAGTYTVDFSTSAPVADVSGEARVTVFMGDVPDGFTAWEEETAAEARRR